MTEAASGGSDSQAGGSSVEAENTRLKQQISNMQTVMRNAQPDFELGQAIRRAPGGREILKRLTEGKPLTAEQSAQVEEATEGGTQPLTMESLLAVLDERDERQRARQDAQELLKESKERLSKELPGYLELHRSDEFRKRFEHNYNGWKSGVHDLPLEFEDAHEWLAKLTYSQFQAENPDLGKTTPAAKSEEERKKEIGEQSTSSSDSTPGTGGDGIPEGATEAQAEELRIARQRPPHWVGKSFANRKGAGSRK